MVVPPRFPTFCLWLSSTSLILAALLGNGQEVSGFPSHVVPQVFGVGRRASVLLGGGIHHHCGNRRRWTRLADALPQGEESGARGEDGSIPPEQADRRSVLRRGVTLSAVILGGGGAGLVKPPLLLSSPAGAVEEAGRVGGSSLPSPTTTTASSSVQLTVPRTKSVLVLGASGGTGRQCVLALLRNGRKCIATTRSGEWTISTTTQAGDDGGEELDVIQEEIERSIRSKQLLVAEESVDVTSYSSLSSAVGGRDVGAVIFAASASARGGGAPSVDRDGVINAARCCIENDISRLVVVSSGTVTRPDSLVYQLLNVVGKGIMEAKIAGEDAVRDMYTSSSAADPTAKARGLGYTIIRPGGLTMGPSLGPPFLELNQGDDKSGRLSRADVAGLCVSCLDSADAFDTTFECYEASTAKPVESVGLSNLLRKTDGTAYRSGKERRGETYDELFRGLEKDAA